MKTTARIDSGALPAGIAAAYGKLIEAIWEHGSLDPQIRELVRMRTAIELDCKL